MTSKQKKQAARAEKQFDDIVRKGHKVRMPEKQKKPSQANRKGGGVSDRESEDEMVEHYIRLLRFLLPGALAKLSTIEDPRGENMCDHSLPTLLLYGLLMFLMHIPSRRAANQIGRAHV